MAGTVDREHEFFLRDPVGWYEWRSAIEDERERRERHLDWLDHSQRQFVARRRGEKNREEWTPWPVVRLICRRCPRTITKVQMLDEDWLVTVIRSTSRRARIGSGVLTRAGRESPRERWRAECLCGGSWPILDEKIRAAYHDAVRVGRDEIKLGVDI